MCARKHLGNVAGYNILQYLTGGAVCGMLMVMDLH